MQPKYLKLAIIAAFSANSAATFALPFNSFDPRSMSMGGSGVAIGDPATAPFFNPALLSASDAKLKYSIELINIGGRLYDPGNLHTNAQTLADNSNLLTSNANLLASNATTLSADTTTLSNNVTNLSNVGTLTAGSLTSISANLATVQGNLSTVSNDMSVVSNNATAVSTNMDKVNNTLMLINNQPIQAELGAATVLGIPGQNWGMAFYADAWTALGGSLVYKDAATVSSISGAVNTTAGALSSSASVISSTSAAQTTLTTATASLNSANTACAASSTSVACVNGLVTAANDLKSATTALTNASNTLSTNATTVSNQSSTVSTNKKVQSQIHLRGVVVSEAGLSISHGFVSDAHSWAIGVTPKLMQLQVFDALLDANNGNSTSQMTGNDYLAKYNTFNFDLGVAKSYNNGWRTGLVVKNVLPQSFDFKRAPTPGATPVATGDTLNINPQVRTGVSHSTSWSTVALDVDLLKNNPAGLETQSQFVSLGGELSAWGWMQLRAGYRYDLANADQKLISLGFGLSPRIPYFKPHLDLAVTASPDALSGGSNTGGGNNITQVGVALKAGFNF